jgi:hypothetical protein
LLVVGTGVIVIVRITIVKSNKAAIQHHCFNHENSTRENKGERKIAVVGEKDRL